MSKDDFVEKMLAEDLVRETEKQEIIKLSAGKGPESQKIKAEHERRLEEIEKISKKELLAALTKEMEKHSDKSSIDAIIEIAKISGIDKGMDKEFKELKAEADKKLEKRGFFTKVRDYFSSDSPERKHEIRRSNPEIDGAATDVTKTHILLASAKSDPHRINTYAFTCGEEYKTNDKISESMKQYIYDLQQQVEITKTVHAEVTTVIPEVQVTQKRENPKIDQMKAGFVKAGANPALTLKPRLRLRKPEAKVVLADNKFAIFKLQFLLMFFVSRKSKGLSFK
jgi:hypothetical protein